jgi:hypothetical protein
MLRFGLLNIIWHISQNLSGTYQIWWLRILEELGKAYLQKINTDFAESIAIVFGKFVSFGCNVEHAFHKCVTFVGGSISQVPALRNSILHQNTPIIRDLHYIK